MVDNIEDLDQGPRYGMLAEFAQLRGFRDL
jgi:hypothetical protein